MPIVGLTGGFGTGKSFVAGLFKKMGADVVDADRIAHRILKKGSVTYKRIVAVFGSSILDAGGSINRKKLGKIVFGGKEKLSMLNRIIHPVVIDEIKNKIRESKNDILVVDAPLICETGILRFMDKLIVVKASRQKQIDRCMKKFSIRKKDVCKRMTCQMPLKTKIKKADYCIDNNGTRKETEMQAKKVWQHIKKGARLWR